MEKESVEVTFNLKGVSLRLLVADAEELKTKLPRMVGIFSTAQILESILQRASEYAGLYYLDSEKEVVLCVEIEQMVDRIGIILFARHPLSVNRETFTRNGVKSATLRSNLTTNSKYFFSEKTGGPVSLTSEGLRWVTKEIIPKYQKRTNNS